MRLLRRSQLVCAARRSRPPRWAADGRRSCAQDLPIGVARTTAAAAAPRGSTSSASTGRAAAPSSSGRAASRGRWSAWRRARARGRGSARTAAPPRHRRRAAGGSATRTGSGRPTGSRWTLGGDVRRLRAWYVWSPVAAFAAARGLDGRLAEDRPALGVERERRDPARRAALRDARRASPSSTTRPARTRTRPPSRAAIVRGDRALPRAGERLERHRLQLPRRQVRPGVRGPVRRHRAQRRSARTRRGSTPARSASR